MEIDKGSSSSESSEGRGGGIVRGTRAGGRGLIGDLAGMGEEGGRRSKKLVECR